MIEKNDYAPVVIFTYRRLDTLIELINNLKKNSLSNKTEIYIFSDGYKNKKDKKDVLNVRNYVRKISGFKKINLCNRKKNIGLTKNLSQGISKVINNKKKVIILEDDIIVSKNFLRFMNLCLNKYKNNKKIWHINAWNYNFKIKKSNYDVFFWRGMHCWGWGTWSDRWKFYERKPKKVYQSYKNDDIYKFNYDGTYNFWSQIERNYKKRINTWAIFWYEIIYRNNGLCVSPIDSLSKNIGNDKYATHTFKNIEKFYTNIPKKLSQKKNFKFQSVISENLDVYNQIKKYLKLNKLKRLLKKPMRLFKI